MSPAAKSGTKSQSLQQAASTIFVLTGLLPFLIFVYLIFMLNGMQDWRVQLGLAIALGFSLLGFSVLVTTMRRASYVIQLLMRAEAPRVALPPPVRMIDVNAPDGLPAAAPTGGAHGKAVAHAKKAGAVDFAPAVGSIKELQDAANAVGRRWRDEAEKLMGRAVRVHVMNFDEPEVGMLIRTSDDGLILEQAGQELGVLWRFVSSIELYANVDVLAEATP